MITHFGVLGRFDLDEWCVDQVSQASRNLRLSNAGRADQDQVAGTNLITEVIGQLPASPTVANGDRSGAFGGILADDILVELCNDLFGCQFKHEFVILSLLPDVRETSVYTLA